ncbi:MAG TPA: two-component regulator propeller domain-containing protein, partial [Candidatus Sulfotelmatobacter sp.]|nr:two-component regulator propeller domain-containing protein [Candidatus Sulfotelmatobacter sp.]
MISRSFFSRITGHQSRVNFPFFSRHAPLATRHFFLAAALLFLTVPCAFPLDPSLDISQYAHTAWKIRDAFTRGYISSIVQTTDGYLWLGTEFGLYRFDGVRAVPWQPPAGQQLPSNNITALLVAHDGTLWIGTTKGLASWKDGKLTDYPEIAGSAVSSLLQDREGTVWLAVFGPGRVCAIRSGQAHCDGEGRFGTYALALYEDHKGNLWVTASTGVWRWSPGPPDQYTLPRGVVEINGAIESDSGTLLMATNDGLKQLVDGKILNYALPGVTGKFRPVQIFRSSDGSLWVGTTQGLLHLHQGRFDAFGVIDGLSGDFAARIFEDREGNIWVSTLGGLDRFCEYAVRRIGTNQGLSSTGAYSIQATPDGAIWIGTSTGLNRWENGHVTIYVGRGTLRQSGRGGEREPSVGGMPTEIANSGLTGTPRSLGQDDQKRLWVSTSDGVFYLDGARFTRVPGFQGRNTFPGIAGDGHGKVWIGDFILGLSHFTPGNDAQPIPWSQFGQKNFGAQTFLADRSEGGLWLGFLEGGIAYFKGGQVRASYTAADGLGRGRVDDLRFGSRGALWAATEGGLSRIRDGRIQTLTSKNGLPCDQVHWSIEDDDHAVWAYTSCGLVHTAESELDAWVNDPKRIIETRVFDAYDGVRSLAVYGGYGPHVTKSPDGKIWFVTYDGVSVIDPRHLPFNKLPPPVHIEQVIADRKTYWQNWSGDASSHPKLPPLVRDLTIDYTALSLVVAEKVRFRYKLEGWDRDWQDAGTRRQAFYTNLSPRKYRFRVMACNNSGVWNEEGTFLDFSIAPAYWQTNWFRALCVLAFVAIIWAAHRLRVRVLEERQGILERHQAVLEQHQGEIGALNERLMKAQEEERIRIAGELHDGVLQQLTSLALQLGTATLALPPDSESKAEVREVEKKLIHVGAEIRQLSHELHPAVLHEKGLPDALSAYCEEFSTTRGIPISYEGDESVEELSPGAALCIYRIAQEALGNVAKHA